MDFEALEKLIADVGNNPEVLELMDEIEDILDGKDSRTKLLAFLPMIAKVLYHILDKDGEESALDMIESVIQILLSEIEKNKFRTQ